jgi:hypothetical protein
MPAAFEGGLDGLDVGGTAGDGASVRARQLERFNLTVPFSILTNLRITLQYPP